MKNRERPVYITRIEFYSALLLTWIYLMSILGYHLEKWQWSPGLLFIGSFVMVGYCIWEMWRAKKAQKKSAKSL